MRVVFTIAAAVLGMMMLSAPALAQGYGSPSLGAGFNIGYDNIVQTPEIQLGSDLTPTVVKIPSVIEETPGLPPVLEGATVSYVAPASADLLATRHFDYIVSPLDEVRPGSMDDTSISLGEYARQLRAEKSHESPGAMAQPSSHH